MSSPTLETTNTNTNTTTNTIIVTMFFDLSKLVDANLGTRPMSFYLEHARTTLSLPRPMIIFCDDVTRGPLQRIREEELAKQSSDLVKTWYIERRFEDYDLYSLYWQTVTDNRRQRLGYKNPNDRNTVSYYLLMLFKLHTIYYAHQFFCQKRCLQGQSPSPPDHTVVTHFAWIDMGCNHIVRDVAKWAPLMVDHPRDKIGVCYIHYRAHDQLYPYSRFMEHGAGCGIAATCFTVAADYVVRFHAATNAIFFEMLMAGYGHSDETILTYTFDRWPELFTLHYGDYFSVLQNYVEPIADLDAIFRFFLVNLVDEWRAQKDSFDKNKKAVLDDAIRTIVQSMDKHGLDHEHLWWLRDYLAGKII